MKKNILVIDDEVSVVDTLKIILSDAGNIEGFLSINNAKKYLKTNPHLDFIIIDYRIGKDNGIEFYKKEFKQKKKNIPAVLISAIKGHHQNANMTEEENKLFIKVFEKPFDAFELKDFVETYLNQK